MVQKVLKPRVNDIVYVGKALWAAIVISVGKKITIMYLTNPREQLPVSSAILIAIHCEDQLETTNVKIARSLEEAKRILRDEGRQWGSAFGRNRSGRGLTRSVAAKAEAQGTPIKEGQTRALHQEDLGTPEENGADPEKIGEIEDDVEDEVLGNGALNASPHANGINGNVERAIGNSSQSSLKASNALLVPKVTGERANVRVTDTDDNIIRTMEVASDDESGDESDADSDDDTAGETSEAPRAGQKRGGDDSDGRPFWKRLMPFF